MKNSEIIQDAMSASQRAADHKAALLHRQSKAPTVTELQGRPFAIRVARSFMKTGKPPADEPYWRNMRLAVGSVPADICTAYHLPSHADFGDVLAAITRDKSEPAGRRMIEFDKTGKLEQVEDIHQEALREFDERQKERRTERLADAKAAGTTSAQASRGAK